MKKIISMLAGALTALTASAFSEFVTTTTDALRVWAEFPATIVADGQTVNYVKVFEHDDDGTVFTAFNMEFILPEGFSVNKVKVGREMVDDIFLSDRKTSTHGISCNIVDGVDLRIIADSDNNSDFFSDDEEGNPLDEIFTIGLICAPSLPTGDYQISNEGIKFVLSNGDARVPASEPFVYTVHVESSDPTQIEEISVEELADTDCYDLAGRKIVGRVPRGRIVVAHGTKYLTK